MKVLFVYRHPDMGFSIGKVFRPIETEMKKFADVDSIYMPVKGYSFIALHNNIMFVRKILSICHYDIVHITGTENYLIPFIRGNAKIVVTVHDFLSMVNIKNPLKRWVKSLLFIRTLKMADKVVFISVFSRNECNKYVDLEIGRVCVIHNPLDPKYSYSPKVINRESPVLLHIGTTPNKNLLRTIAALKGMSWHLRIVGPLSVVVLRALNDCNVQYSNVYNLSEEEIIKEYQNCDFVNFPSTYEGFGMPIIEGGAIGRVVITSNLAPMNEVAGGSCPLVDPYSIESIKLGYKDAIGNSESYIQIGLENAKKYAIDEVTSKYYSLYKELLSAKE